jgi:hypothetical protein
MAKNPSTRWYFNDWMTDLGVRQCSAAARGLWMEMLCIAANADGYVKLDGKPCTLCDLARHTGWHKASVSRWLHELERNGVFSRTGEGTIYNRRMVRQNGAKTPKKTHRERGTNQGDLPGIEAPLLLQTQEATLPLKDSPLPDKPETLDAAREKKKEEGQVKVEGNPEGGRCAPLGRGETVHSERDAAITETPVEVVSAGAKKGSGGARPDEAAARPPRRGTDDARTSLPSPVADPNRLGPGDQARTDPLAGSASSPSTRFGALRGCEPCPRTGKSPAPKSPALKAKIRDQLISKHARFLTARKRPAEVAAYWAAMLGDDAAEAQRMLDATDGRMRRAGWDDMRAWKAQHGIAA